MTLGFRLLRGGGPGVFVPIPEQGRWVRNGGNPVLTDPGSTGASAQEMSPFYVGPGDWRANYRLGWSAGPGTSPVCSVGYATSPDGIVWTRYGSNPVLGQGGSSVAYSVVQPNTYLFGSTYWCFFNNANDQSKHVATSTDLIHWTPGTVTITYPSGMSMWGNVFVWKEGATWYGLFECAAPSTYWRTHLYTSSDGLTWTILNGGVQLSSLQIASGSAYGAPWMPNGGAKIDGRYQLWYHASPVGATSNGNLPTDCYHASSTDRINWTQVTPNPILTHLGGSTFEKEQIADVKVIEAAGASFMFYSGVDDTGGHASIGLAQFAGTLAQIVAGT